MNLIKRIEQTAQLLFFAAMMLFCHLCAMTWGTLRGVGSGIRLIWSK